MHHDPYVTTADLGLEHTGNVRAMVVQWQFGRMEVVWPSSEHYSRMFRLPPRMYPLITDINFDGKVDMKDIGMAARAFGTYPCHPRWRMEADLPPCDGKVDMKDIGRIARDFGKTAECC